MPTRKVRRASQPRAAAAPETDNSSGLAWLYMATAALGGLLIVGVVVYLFWGDAKTVVVNAASDALKASATVDMKDQVTRVINEDVGEGAWGPIEFNGPYDGEPIRARIAESLAGTPAAESFAQPQPDSAACRIVINKRSGDKLKKGVRPGRETRVYWWDGQTLRQIKQGDPEYAALFQELSKISSTEK